MVHYFPPKLACDRSPNNSSSYKSRLHTADIPTLIDASFYCRQVPRMYLSRDSGDVGRNTFWSLNTVEGINVASGGRMSHGHFVSERIHQRNRRYQAPLSRFHSLRCPTRHALAIARYAVNHPVLEAAVYR
jgi:hypothetical protein